MTDPTTAYSSDMEDYETRNECAECPSPHIHTTCSGCGKTFCILCYEDHESVCPGPTDRTEPEGDGDDDL